VPGWFYCHKNWCSIAVRVCIILPQYFFRFYFLMRFLVFVFLYLCVVQFVFAYDRVNRTLNYAAEQKRADAIAPLGIAFSGVELFPFMGIGEEYNDNIFSSELLVVDDFITHLSPGFNLQTNWNRHYLALKVNTDLAFYAQYSKQNYQDVTVDFDSRLDVLNDSALHFSIFFGSLHEDRQSVEQQGGIEPTTYTVLDIDTFYEHTFNRFSVIGAFDVARWDYDNVELITGAIRNNQDRNRWDYIPSMRFAYEVHPQLTTFFDVRYTNIDYDQTQDRNGFERSSQGVGAVLGLDFDVTGLITGDMALGYQYRTYKDPELENISSPVGWFSLDWSVTPLMTVHSRISQTIGETIQRDVSGANITSVNLGIEHELLRSLLLKLDGGYSFMKYQGFDASHFDDDRTEHRYFVAVGGKYTFSRYFYMDLTYRYNTRNSNRPLNDYDQNSVFLDFVARM